MPKFFRVEGTTRVGRLHELIAHTPAVISSFDDVYPARLVAAIRVVVTSEEVAVIIEDQILRVAQAVGENLEVGAIFIAAKNAAALRFPDRFTIAHLYVGAAIAN